MEQAIISGVAHDRSESKITVVGVPDKVGEAAAILRDHLFPRALGEPEIGDAVPLQCSKARTGASVEPQQPHKIPPQTAPGPRREQRPPSVPNR